MFAIILRSEYLLKHIFQEIGFVCGCRYCQRCKVQRPSCFKPFTWKVCHAGATCSYALPGSDTSPWGLVACSCQAKTKSICSLYHKGESEKTGWVTPGETEKVILSWRTVTLACVSLCIPFPPYRGGFNGAISPYLEPCIKCCLNQIYIYPHCKKRKRGGGPSRWARAKTKTVLSISWPMTWD